MNRVAHQHRKTAYTAHPRPPRLSIGDMHALPAASGPLAWVRHSARLLRQCRERSRQRRRLQMLNDRLLEDIGLTRADVELEVRKWPWMK